MGVDHHNKHRLRDTVTDAERNTHAAATVANTNPYGNSGISDTHSTGTNSHSHTNNYTDSSGAAQQPLNSDASPDR